jgi:hypothetical protein
MDIKNIYDAVIFTSAALSIKDALIEAVSKKADLHGADLRGADLRGADLHGADLYGADLRGAGAGVHRESTASRFRVVKSAGCCCSRARQGGAAMSDRDKLAEILFHYREDAERSPGTAMQTALDEIQRVFAALASERQHMLQPVTDSEWSAVSGYEANDVDYASRESVNALLAARLERAKAVQP